VAADNRHVASTEPPTGTVTFLFTDIEGSTHLTESLGGRWPPLLERHRHLLRIAWVQHGGVEVSTEGDSFFVVFTSALAAVTAAVQGQRDLAAEPWPEGAHIRVRMGLHTGEGVLGGGSYVGLDVHRAARIAAAGHGGQVLLSAATRALVEESLPPGVALVDLGEHGLKDLTRAERIWQLAIEGQPTDFPALKTAAAAHPSLPAQLTSFLGREREISEVAHLLPRSRLLTLVGPGGTGKTRLALQVAERVGDHYPDGVHFVALAPVRDSALVLSSIAQTVGLPPSGGQLQDRLPAFLGDKRLLLVLDNFEQVCDAGPVVAELLQRAPNVAALVTSRSALRVSGEHEYAVQPLPVPRPDGADDPGAIAAYDSVALFVERAQAVRADFALTGENAVSVAQICAGLDGLPLAIELAAARVRSLSPQAIAARLDHRLTLLSAGARDLPQRQRTLSAAIDWSHDLLGRQDRQFFARFSVFASGAGLSAAEEVVLLPGIDGAVPGDDGDVLDCVDSLVANSLLRAQGEADGEPRFGMLETIREYAAEKLAERGEDDLFRERHAQWVAGFVERQAAEVLGAGRREVLDRIEREHDSVRAALAWSIAHRPDLAARIFVGTWRYWQTRGFLTEARRHADQVMALLGEVDDTTHRAAAAEAAGGIAYWQGDIDAAYEWYRDALDLARASGDPRRIADALYNITFPAARRSASPDETITVASEAMDLYRSLGDEAGVGRTLWAIGSSLYAIGEVERGRPYAEDALAALADGDDRFMAAWAYYMAGAFNMTVDADLARERLLAAHRLFTATNDTSGHVLVFQLMATLAWLEGDVARALRIAGYAGTVEQRTGTGLARVNQEQVGFRPEELAQDPALAAELEAGRRLSREEAVQLVFGEG
jgi:predicted ATPase/class 3 adenylate cyclase